MPANYVLLSKTTLGATAASVTFSNIPQSGYTDLKILFSARTDAPGDTYDNLKIYPNGLSTNLTSKYLGSYSGTTPFSGSNTAGVIANAATGATATTNTFGNGEIYIPNYTSANYKSISIDAVAETNAADGRQGLTAFLWSSTAAITSLQILPSAGSIFLVNSTFYLYGIAAVGTTPVIAPFATGGDVITNDGTYWIHTFLSSGTFTPAKNLTCGYLVVAGGGGGGGCTSGGYGPGGGAGAGGFRSTVTATGGGGSLESALTLSLLTNYTVTIGGGGAGGVGNSVGSSGANSVFSTITSTGGGGGGHYSGAASGLSGGSGGGAAYGGSAGTGTANQGYNGGGNTGIDGGGGGGGAGQIGYTANTNTVGANGGNGVATSITGSSVTYAGGGGGGDYNGGAGTGGSGGGGNGGHGAQNGFGGSINTGSGGGGAGGTATQNGGAGGSGIVIVRYLMA